MILISRIEYLANIIVLSKNKINNLMAKCRRLIRGKMGMSNTVPNCVIQNEEVYKLIDFNLKQATKQIQLLQYKLSEQGILGESTEIRLRHL